METPQPLSPSAPLTVTQTLIKRVAEIIMISMVKNKLCQ